MSRQELADTANAYIWHRHGVNEHLDAHDIGKLERGEHRWPGARRREAFRAILGADTDAELGFYITRRSPGNANDGPDAVAPAGPNRLVATDVREVFYVPVDGHATTSRRRVRGQPALVEACPPNGDR